MLRYIAIIGLILIPSVLQAEEQFELTLSTGVSFAIYAPVFIRGDSLFANTMEYNTMYSSGKMDALMGENMLELIDKEYPKAIVGYSLNEVTHLTVHRSRTNYAAYGVSVAFGAVTGYAFAPKGDSDSGIEEEGVLTAIFMGAAGAIIGYFIGDYIDQKYKRYSTVQYDLTVMDASEIRSTLRTIGF